MAPQKQKTKANSLGVFIVVCIGLSALVASAAAVKSLGWRYVHDSPLMIYSGFLVERGAVPYRDFFDMNMPGTYALMWFMGKVFGWSDLGFRVFDLLYLAVLSFLTFRWIRPSGLLSALAAPAHRFTLHSEASTGIHEGTEAEKAEIYHPDPREQTMAPGAQHDARVSGTAGLPGTELCAGVEWDDVQDTREAGING
jgi:hypothetical protein